jgi:hypothetical protein
MSLDRTTSQLSSRFRSLGQALSEALGLRHSSIAQFRPTENRSGVIIWGLQRGEHTVHIEGNRRPDTVIRLARSGSEIGLWFGLSEEWRRTGRDRISFVESRLRFYVSEGQQSQPNMTAVLRLEWMDRELTEERLFPGSGAAHPHWQFDDPTEPNAEAIASELLRPKESETSAIDVTHELLSDKSTEPAPTLLTTLPAGRYRWFHKIHFAARAEWATREICNFAEIEQTQHAHSPFETSELDRWIISALLYVRNEFEKYAF